VFVAYYTCRWKVFHDIGYYGPIMGIVFYVISDSPGDSMTAADDGQGARTAGDGTGCQLWWGERPREPARR